MAQGLQCVGVRTYVRTYIRMCNDIHTYIRILLCWLNGFMYDCTNELQYTVVHTHMHVYALRVCILLYTNVYANDIRTYLLHWVHMYYCILNLLCMYVRTYITGWVSLC